DGPLTRLEVVTPHAVLYRGEEPGQRLTPAGALWLLAGPLVLLALAFAVGLGPGSGRPLVPVLVLLGAALAAGVGAALGWRPRAPLLDRALDYAWTRMAPRLHAGGFAPPDADFLGGLALVSAGRGDPERRRPALTATLALTEQAAATRGDAAGPLAALRR